MDNEDEEPHRPSTSRGQLSDPKPSGCPKESSRLNNNIVNCCDASECCTDCDTAAQQDHMIAASLVHCDQEDNGSDIDDDCCIYTYRGDSQEPVVDNMPADDRNASPLMDYLEMDFEPEPTASHESEDEDDGILPERIDNEPMLVVAEEPGEPTVQIEHVNFIPLPLHSYSSSGNIFGVQQEHQATCTSFNVTTNANPDLPPKVPIQSTSLCNGLKEERNGCLRRNADTTEVCHKLKRMRVDDLSWVKEMVWSESDAHQFQINQLGKSACGATSVVNTLLALRVPFDIDYIKKTINTRLRDDTATLIPYLESRAVAGCMPQDLVRTLETVTDSLVSARFFATHQNLDLPIAPWLASWIKKGAVPILTLNQQRAPPVPYSPVPDSWHHQMMYGVSYNPLRPECAHVYLTNPLGRLPLEAIRPQLLSPSTLMIRRDDILSRWTPQTDLMSLVTHPSLQWHELNVLGQVVNLLREAHEFVQFTEHIVIPANYQSGITLAIKTSSNYSHELKTVPEL